MESNSIQGKDLPALKGVQPAMDVIGVPVNGGVQ